MITIKGNIMTIKRLKKFSEKKVIAEICSFVHYMNLDMFRESICPPGTYNPNDPIWKENQLDIDAEKSASIWFDQYSPEEKVQILKMKPPVDQIIDTDSWEKLINILTQQFREQQLSFLE